MHTNVLVLFDIDGTLLMAGDRAHGQALLDAFQDVYELEPDLDGVPLAGMLDAQITRLLLEKHGPTIQVTDGQIAQVMERMGDLYSHAMIGVSLQDRLLPGAAEAVDAAASCGWTAGTLTGNARRVAELKLGAAGLGHLTQIGAFGDNSLERGELVKIAIERAEIATDHRFQTQQTVLIGDTPQDVTAALHAGARVVAVATGRYDAAELAACRPDATLPDLADTAVFTETVKQVLQISAV